MDHAGHVRAQRHVADKSNEIPAFQPLLDSIDLTGTVITADALHSAHYIAQVKANHPGLFDRVRRLPWREITLDHQDRTRAHHRLEIRRLKTVTFAHLDYPDARKQSAVLDDATRLAPQIIAGRLKGAAVEGLETAAVAAFGESEARAILMVLGPADTQGAAPRSDRSIQAVDCNSQCAGTGSCSTVCYASCNWSDYGCGPLWLGPCNGFCS